MGGFQLGGRQESLYALPFHNEATFVHVKYRQGDDGGVFLKFFKLAPNNFLPRFLKRELNISLLVFRVNNFRRDFIPRPQYFDGVSDVCKFLSPYYAGSIRGKVHKKGVFLRPHSYHDALYKLFNFGDRDGNVFKEYFYYRLFFHY